MLKNVQKKNDLSVNIVKCSHYKFMIIFNKTLLEKKWQYITFLLGLQ